MLLVKGCVPETGLDHQAQMYFKFLLAPVPFERRVVLEPICDLASTIYNLRHNCGRLAAARDSNKRRARLLMVPLPVVYIDDASSHVCALPVADSARRIASQASQAQQLVVTRSQVWRAHPRVKAFTWVLLIVLATHSRTAKMKMNSNWHLFTTEYHLDCMEDGRIPKH